MKKILPIFLLLLLVSFVKPVLATASIGSNTSATATTDNVQAALATCDSSNPVITHDKCFVQDADVEFAGNVAARSRDLLNWTFKYYQWSYQADNFNHIWKSVRTIVFYMLLLCVLVASFLLIITRGKSLTVRKFIPTFILVAILVYLSFAIIQFLYDRVDNIQGFFLNSPNHSGSINDTDLLHLGFDYGQKFGYRLADPQYDESVFITLLLTKLTAISYYAMFAILMIRKIILWFFLIVSPIFPLLLLFPLVRNSAKIWIGEFFRWLLYGPLFAVFLAGLVALWTAGIPLSFKCNTAEPTTPYTTSTALLLGGPCQTVTINNNLNDINTFSQYVVSLMMLWAVIILPFILLKIFMDYFNNFSLTESNIVKYLARAGTTGGGRPGLARVPGVSGTPSTPPGFPPPATTGLAKSIPSFEHSAISEIQKNMAETAREQSTTSNLAAQIEQQVAAQNQAAVAAGQAAGASAASRSRSEVNRMESQIAQAGSSQPAISQAAIDIEANVAAAQSAEESAQAGTPLGMVITQEQARSEPMESLYPRLNNVFDSIKTTITTPVEQITQQFKEAISDVFNVTNLNIPTLTDIARFDTEVSTKEASERVETNKVTEIINRIAGVSPIATPVERQQYAGIREKLVNETKKGNSLAYSILSASTPHQAPISEINLVQQVSVDDYENVKKLWKDNYSKAQPPMGLDGKPQDRQAWLKDEVKKIPEVIDLLLSGDPQKVAQGKEMVSKILPFLLLGGFSKAEIIAYLKAKLAAAKEVMNEVLEVEKDEENKVSLERKVEEKPKTMEAEEQIPDSTELPDHNDLTSQPVDVNSPVAPVPTDPTNKGGNS